MTKRSEALAVNTLLVSPAGKGEHYRTVAPAWTDAYCDAQIQLIKAYMPEMTKPEHKRSARNTIKYFKEKKNGS